MKRFPCAVTLNGPLGQFPPLPRGHLFLSALAVVLQFLSAQIFDILHIQQSIAVHQHTIQTSNSESLSFIVSYHVPYDHLEGSRDSG